MNLSARTTRHTESPCVNCAKLLDAASMFTFGDEEATPDEGDFTVCLYCRHLMVFNADLSLRNPTDDEIKLIAGDQRVVSTMELLGAYDLEQNLEARRRAGESQAGDEEARRQVYRKARRAALAFLKASVKMPGLE